MKTKHDYVKDSFDHREQTRWDTTNINDAATLLMTLMELEWRYHHLAMLYYRNHHHKEFHTYWGMYTATRRTISILFPYQANIPRYSQGCPESNQINELNRLIEEQDAEMMEKFK